ncbi:MAG: hypothetical protein K1X89_13460 [Myxococcaceae bacterium]|nr:hypothetical protein [Myxococcaceae bacterium]
MKTLLCLSVVTLAVSGCITVKAQTTPLAASQVLPQPGLSTPASNAPFALSVSVDKTLPVVPRGLAVGLKVGQSRVGFSTRGGETRLEAAVEPKAPADPVR